MFFLAADLYQFLEQQGCEFLGDEFLAGYGWVSGDDQMFALPKPDEINGRHWFDAYVIEDNFRDRWLGYKIPLDLPRYSMGDIGKLAP